MKPYQIFSYRAEAHPPMPHRPERSNKKTFGRVLCICGSEGMAGAAYFAAKAAYRTGAGLVELFTPAVNRPLLQSMLPEAIVVGYDARDGWQDALAAAMNRADVMVIGCGLGQTTLARQVLSFALRHGTCPKVIDADGLNLLAKHPSLLAHAKGAVLTPHPLEMSRLCSLPLETVLEQTETVAYEFAGDKGVICVLKDHETVVSDGGNALYRNQTGNSGMATGGSGDVLAGVLGGLLAQRAHSALSILEMTALGVYLHSLAGDLAAEELSAYSVMASDVLDALPKAIQALMKTDHERNA